MSIITNFFLNTNYTQAQVSTNPISVTLKLLVLQVLTYIIFLEPGTSPRNVQVRPLSSSTMVIQWDEPETPNGQVTVRYKIFFNFFQLNSHFSFIGLQSLLHDKSPTSNGLVGITKSRQ